MHLVETRGKVAPYVCLSHCWGKHDFTKTMTSTLEGYKLDIPWQELPKTFKDAITFASRLGYVYLWLDSFCIIQDSIQDWRLEGSKMSEIYANARLTIAAAASSSASGGCFSTSFEHRVAKYTYQDANGIDVDIHVQDKIDHTKWADSEL